MVINTLRQTFLFLYIQLFNYECQTHLENIPSIHSIITQNRMPFVIKAELQRVIDKTASKTNPNEQSILLKIKVLHDAIERTFLSKWFP